MAVRGRADKMALFDALASVAKGIGSGRRAEIIELLAQSERSVEKIAEATGQSTANTSHHLRVLAASGLVASRRDGVRVIYRLSSPHVLSLWIAIREVAVEQVAEVERLADAYLGDLTSLEPLERDELRARLERGEAVVWDVRPRAEYDAGHIRGARWVPPSRVEEELAALPDGVEVVAYCRGPYCVLAVDAVRRLQAAGVPARRLEDGFPEWKLSGLPTASAVGG